MGRYDGNEYADMSDVNYNPYNMKNNSSLMLDQTGLDNNVRRSGMDLPRKLHDYQQSRKTMANRDEKNDSVLIDPLDVT